MVLKKSVCRQGKGGGLGARGGGGVSLAGYGGNCLNTKKFAYIRTAFDLMQLLTVPVIKMNGQGWQYQKW